MLFERHYASKNLPRPLFRKEGGKAPPLVKEGEGGFYYAPGRRREFASSIS
jgi:hypothetical protein